MRRLRLFAIFAALTVLAFFMLAHLTRSMLYPAPPVTVPSPPGHGLGEVRLPLPGGGEAVGWVLEPPGLPAEAPVAVFLHGNGENLETMRRWGLFGRVRRLGVMALAVDYPGYGRSGGRPGEEGVIGAASAGIAWAREHHPERPVTLVGWSLGAASALGAAAREVERGGEVAGVAILSPWSSLADVAAVHFPAMLTRWAVREKYDSLAAARTIAGHGVPTLVIHGERDTVIPVDQGRRIAEALREAGEESAAPTRWLPIEGAGHNDLLARESVWDALGRFVREAAEG